MSSLSFALFGLLVSHATHAIPMSRRFSGRNFHSYDSMRRQGNVDGTIGLGDNSDLLYTVPIQLGDTTTVVNLDTGSSDLWVITTDCTTNACAKSRTTHLPAKSLSRTGANVTMRYGDSTTGTYATGNIAIDTVSIAGVAIENQLFAAIEDTTNAVVQFGAAGIFGLGFPTESQIQGAAVTKQFGPQATTDHFVASSYADGPLISRIAQTGALEMAMFAITLQRSTIDISGTGALTLGSLPPGVDNKTITWVPVRLYKPEEGGITAPTFAPNEVYPLRWEIDLDAVWLDGRKVPASKIPTSGGVDATRMSALMDTGNSILRGPKDVVNNILGSISPEYDPTIPNSATLACAQAHNLTFQIGGKMFPIDPRDLIGPTEAGQAQECVVDNLVSTDAPGVGALFRWSLGDPFFRSNLVIFHFGNLTHPSQDPPRIGIVSQVPANAADLLLQAIADAEDNGGNFDSTLIVAPTQEADLKPEVTVRPLSASSQAAGLTSKKAAPTSIVSKPPTRPATTTAPTIPQQTNVGTANDNKTSGASNLRPALAALVLAVFGAAVIW
ncbi:Peptidase A1 domain-containing protein [Mycena indigotica]|uniref:Peptidase A1 domain-containing protein n=1 Tax=Mycena indigotica TaxID=2126181 RepID=A0A8H6WIB9_9AGAR|nr:Peptidase A1 domain-containing protein [Mycena indigotica]KAF7315963.1 Peptidase A1 domain-containing protein [Mycena indigotica]